MTINDIPCNNCGHARDDHDTRSICTHWNEFEDRACDCRDFYPIRHPFDPPVGRRWYGLDACLLCTYEAESQVHEEFQALLLP